LFFDNHPIYPTRVLTNQRFVLKKKFVVSNNQVYRKSEKGQVSACPILATEEWYAVLAGIHKDHGHLGRDALFARVGQTHEGICKPFIASYIARCCTVGLARNRGPLDGAMKEARQEVKRKRNELGAYMEAPEAKRPRMGEDEVSN
jgi:hypothetical protein